MEVEGDFVLNDFRYCQLTIHQCGFIFYYLSFETLSFYFLTSFSVSTQFKALFYPANCFEVKKNQFLTEIFHTAFLFSL